MQVGSWGSRLGTRGQRGFTYVWAIAAVALLGVGLAAVGTVWDTEVRRQREQELLRIGQMYSVAIDSYYRASPGSARQYPESLESLVRDPRYVDTLRHMRKLYADPMDPLRPWGLVRDREGNIRGVHSTSDKVPLRKTAVQLIDGVLLPPATRYADWHFVGKGES